MGGVQAAMFFAMTKAFATIFQALGVATAAILLAAGSAFAQDGPLPEGPADHPVVIELFTSQSCPSCPDADAFAADLNNEPGIIVVSWPVDIWDYLGWEDTLADPENTRRQAQYNGRFGLRWPYTPEMVIDGRTHLAGNDRDAVHERIAEIREDSWVNVSVRVRMSEDRLIVNVGAAPEEMIDPLGTIWLIPYRSHQGIEIGGGPNTGRTLDYVNVAEGYRPISQWAGSPVIVRHEVSRIPGENPDGYIVVLQKHRNGPVLGAARLQLSWNGASAE